MALQENYKTIIDNAVKAIQERVFFAQYPESPKPYGEEAPLKGTPFFKMFCNVSRSVDKKEFLILLKL